MRTSRTRSSFLCWSLIFLVARRCSFDVPAGCFFIVSHYSLMYLHCFSFCPVCLIWSELCVPKFQIVPVLYFVLIMHIWKKTSFVSARCPPCKGQLEEGDNREGGEVGQHSLHPDHCVHLQLKLVALQRENILFSSQKKCYHSITVLLWHYDILWYDGIKVQWYHKGIMLLPGEDSLCGSWEWRQQAEGKAGSEKSI